MKLRILISKFCTCAEEQDSFLSGSFAAPDTTYVCAQTTCVYRQTLPGGERQLYVRGCLFIWTRERVCGHTSTRGGVLSVCTARSLCVVSVLIHRPHGHTWARCTHVCMHVCFYTCVWIYRRACVGAGADGKVTAALPRWRPGPPGASAGRPVAPAPPAALPPRPRPRSLCPQWGEPTVCGCQFLLPEAGA